MDISVVIALLKFVNQPTWALFGTDFDTLGKLRLF